MNRRTIEGDCEVDGIDPSRVAAAREDLPPERLLRRAAEAFQALAHPGRLRVLKAKALDGRALAPAGRRATGA